MDKVAVLDKLNRALEMEEKMAGELIALCQAGSLPEELSPESRKWIGGALESIKKDTLRHKDTVAGIMERLKNG